VREGVDRVVVGPGDGVAFKDEAAGRRSKDTFRRRVSLRHAREAPMTASGTGYRAEIDGLRAVAVVAVVLFHLGFRWIPGGFVGVDVFFVISGFLITGIILGELRAGTFSFRGFWTRRILRIFPALLATIITTLAMTWFIAPKSDHPATGAQAVAALLSVANLWFWRNVSDYWGQAAEISPLLHTWSLSVEEQFYLCLPLLLGAFTARAGRALPWLLAAATLTGLVYFVAGVRKYGFEEMFYLLPSRAWELGLGGCLATTLRRWRQQQASFNVGGGLLAGAGLTLILAAFLLPPGRTRAVIAAVFGAAAVLAWGGSEPCRTLLAWRPIVAIGKASYSIYLWHWPVIVFARLLDEASGRTTPAPLLLVPILLIAAASYAFIEEPTRRDHRSLPYIAAGYVVTFTAACLLAFSSGSYDTSGFEKPTSASGSYNLGRAVRTRANAHLLPPDSAAVPLPDAYLEGGIIVGGAAAPEVVVLGDSHGTMWCHAIRGVTESLGITASFYCAQGASPFVHVPGERAASFSVEEKRRFDEARLQHIARWKPAVVIMCARWCLYTAAAAEPLLDFLDTHAGRVVLVEQVPEAKVAEGRDVLSWLCYKKIMPAEGVRQFLPEWEVAKNEAGRRLLRSLAAAHPRCEVVSLRDIYIEPANSVSRVLVLDGRRVVYEDNDHLTDYGTSLGVGRIEAAIRRALAGDAPTPAAGDSDPEPGR
jgi:peptidoglycan/LPS O-acetylase OafA/YrhL